MNFDILPMAERHIAGFQAVLDVVAREGRFLARTKAPALDKVREFWRDNVDRGNPHYVAVRDEIVVGWCDIVRLRNPLTSHTGLLGMGVLPAARGSGVGAALLETALEEAWSRNFVRIELTVFADNTPAIALYERAGFAKEGELIDAARFEEGYANSYVMGLVRR